jgi:hypothetical protein
VPEVYFRGCLPSVAVKGLQRQEERYYTRANLLASRDRFQQRAEIASVRIADLTAFQISGVPAVRAASRACRLSTQCIRFYRPPASAFKRSQDSTFLFPQRAAAAFFAITDRAFFVRAAARALPPFMPPDRDNSLCSSGVIDCARSFPSATAAAFFLGSFFTCRSV